MKVGIVGMPNAGKSSLFTALTGVAAEAANYPFTTIEPNVAVVPVTDMRLDEVAATVKSSKVVPDTIETELIYADLEQAERRLDRVSKSVKSGDRRAIAEAAWLKDLIEALQSGKPARTVAPPADAPDALSLLQPLTAKPVLFVANIEEGGDEVPPAVLEHARSHDAAAVAVTARLEAELSELDEDDAAAMRADLGLNESGLERVVHGAFALLRLVAFFTAGEDKPAQSWHLRDGLSVWHAAGMIHSDMQRGFVRAEVVPWNELVDAGGYAGARDRGTLRLEGRDYTVADGDVITVKFTP